MEAENPNLGISITEPLLKEDNSFHPDFFLLTQIFPVEIWKFVADKLLKPGRGTENLENLSNSSAFFRGLIAPPEYVLEKVLALVGRTVWKNEGLTGLPVKDVLKCRAVSSKWNENVDRLIPETFQHFWDGNEPNSKISAVGQAFASILHNVNFNNYNVDNKNINKIGNFVRHFALTHPAKQSNGRNPTIWGNLLVTIYCENDNDEIDEDENERGQLEPYQLYSTRIASLLSKYGSYIQYFELEIIGLDLYEKPLILEEWFSQTPNLKELKIRGVYDGWDTDDQETFNMNKYREGFPFPNLNHLHTVDVECFPEPVFNQLILQNSQISTLIVASLKGNYDFLTFPFPNLKELQMEYNSNKIVDKFSSAQVQWPLESLTITYTQSFGNDNLKGGATLGTMFQSIQNKFANSLLSLEFIMQREDTAEDGPVWQDCKNCRLNLPNLKNIRLFVKGSFISLDFLLPMKSNLEKISVCFSYKLPVSAEVKVNTVVQFMGFEENMLNSNIWTIFDKLDKLQVLGYPIDDDPETSLLRLKKSRVYFRKDWLKRNSNVCKQINSGQ